MLCQVFRRVDYLLHSTVKQPTVQHCRPTILGGWPSNTSGPALRLISVVSPLVLVLFNT